MIADALQRLRAERYHLERSAGLTACTYPGNDEACSDPTHYAVEWAEVERVLTTLQGVQEPPRQHYESGNCPHCGAWVDFAQENAIAEVEIAARAPHPERTEPEVKLRSASESVGWLNSVGPLDVSPTFKHPDEPVTARAPHPDTVESYRVEPELEAPDGGDWHVLTFFNGKQIHILTRHPLVIVEPEQH